MAVKSKNTMQSPLTRAKGLGSSKSGTHHWIGQQVAAVALIPLSLFVLISFLAGIVFGDSSYEGARAWLQMPQNGLGVMLLIGVGFFHGANGFQSGIVEDYIHNPAMNLLGYIAIRFFGFVLAAAGLLAVLKVMLGA